MTESKHRRKLNTEQLEVLGLLCKFRFGSNDLIAQYFGKKDRSFVFKRLKILQEQRLVGKRFDSSYRLQGKPAAYYLLPDGARELQKQTPDKPINIKAIYKDKTVSEEFVESCLRVLGIYCQLKAHYGDRLKFFTRGQLTDYDYFEDFVPGVYMRLESEDIEKDFFLEYLSSSKPFFTVTQRLKQHTEYADSGEWEAATSSKFPKLLLVCGTLSLQNRLLKQAAFILSEVDEPEIYVTTKDNCNTWVNLTASEEVVTLSQI